MIPQAMPVGTVSFLLVPRGQCLLAWTQEASAAAGQGSLFLLSVSDVLSMYFLSTCCILGTRLGAGETMTGQKVPVLMGVEL